MDNTGQNIKLHQNTGRVGLNMDSSVNQVPPGALTYALNAAMENYDANSFSYQNEEGNEFCLTFPDELILIGNHFIGEINKHIFFMVNPDKGISEIGYMDNNDCLYHTLVRAACLNFQVNHPILKAVHKINNCTTEIYWTDGVNPRRYLDINNIPYILNSGSALCDPLYTNELDCNQLRLQPNFSIPLLTITNVVNGGNLIAGTYQFAIQYGDALGNSYTSYESITNPTPIADINVITPNFNYPVGKSIVINVDNLDSTGLFQYFNLAVIKTINAISTVELVGVYYIENSHMTITYTGQNVESIQLTIQDIFEKFPYYDIAQDVTATQEILVWSDLTSIDRVNYQSIASQINLQWESWRIPATENYSKETNATNLRGYLRDEVYSFEICFLLKNGKQTDGFHIPGRIKSINENQPDVPDTNPDFIGNPDYVSGGIGWSSYWKIYNTASVTGYSPGYVIDPSYKGPYQYGEFAYWESSEEYPCNEAIWGDLAGQKVRHHKFPDVLVSPICESKVYTGSLAMGNDAVFPIGVTIDPLQVGSLIAMSTVLTSEQKSEIIGFKILRGDRGTNKSIIAKGILRNVGIYEREQVKYYYANYPYNDLNADPFLNVTNNAYQQICKVYNVNITSLLIDPLGGPDYAEVQVTDCNTNLSRIERRTELGIKETCSTTKPIIVAPAEGVIGFADYEQWHVWNNNVLTGTHVGYDDPILGYTIIWLGADNAFADASPRQDINVVVDSGVPQRVDGADNLSAEMYGLVVSTENCGTTQPIPAFDPSLANRQIFNSPETSFGQPFLGTILKIENTMYGAGIAHFVQVKDNAKYRLLTESAQKIALDSSNALGDITIDFSSTAMFAAYQAYLTIYINGITRKNYAYSFNSIADYNYFAAVPNDMGIKQRNLETARYLIPGVQAIGSDPDDYAINNYQRESSVYLKTLGTPPLPFPTVAGVTDQSRFTISGHGNCSFPGKEDPISVVSYYASLKNDIINQWGQIYSYDTIDTGFERMFNFPLASNTIFGGDTFISRFAFKTKIPFFIDNRVGAPDDSDIFYDELGNVGYPKYWHSARSILKDYMSGGGLLSNIISYKAHNFDCPNNGTSVGTSTSSSTTTSSSSSTSTMFPGEVTDSTTATYYDGYFYLFAYGIPNFYCESSYNTDLRQAFNNREGDFWPHVSSSIPDDWEQEHFVSIAQDNTYYYNTTYSKQNKENLFTHLPADWDKACYTYFPFRTIYSDVQTADANNRVNAWLIYRALSYFDFPQNYGKLVSVDGIQNRVILVRFENKSLLYNNLLTIDTSNPQAAYVGNPNMFKGAPPIDFAETDLGYVGSQNKMLLRIPQGQITIDAKRGQIFLISDTQAIDLGAFGSGMNRFFTDHIAFEILRWFPDVDTDNAFTGVGIHGVYDSKYDRVIITKLDYIPLSDDIKYDPETNSFYLEQEIDNVEECDLGGIANILQDCEYGDNNTAIIIPDTTTTSTTTSSTSSTSTTTSSSTTTTTTTLCYTGPVILDMLYLITIDGVTTDFRATFESANQARCDELFPAGRDISFNGQACYSEILPIIVGNTIHLVTNCSALIDGYYINLADGKIVHVVGGIILSIDDAVCV